MSLVKIDLLKSRAVNLTFGDGFYSTEHDAERAQMLIAGFARFRNYDVPLADWRSPAVLPTSLRQSWLFFYHSLTFLDCLRREFVRTGDPACQSVFLATIGEWLVNFRHPPRILPTAQNPGNFSWYDMAVAWRAQILIAALSISEDPQPWLDDIKRHLDVLSRDDFYAGVGNHALHQNNALLSCAAILEDTDAARRALTRMHELEGLSVDVQGVNLEGSPAYHVFNMFWWIETRKRVEAVAGMMEIESTLRFPDMRPFAAECIAPDGKFVLFGDTCLSNAPTRTVLADKFPTAFMDHLREDAALARRLDVALTPANAGVGGLKVFDDGYVFSRWSAQPASFEQPLETLVASRFGAGMSERVHAHDDAASVVFYVGRWRVLEDSGLYGYYGGKSRNFVKSSRAHNIIHINDRKYYRSARSALEASHIAENAVAWRIKAPVWERTAWTRFVIHLTALPGVLVEDIVTAGDGGVSGKQLWNLGDGFQIHSLHRNHLIAIGQGLSLRLDILSETEGMTVHSQEFAEDGEPAFGWRSTLEGEIHPIKTVAVNFSGARSKIRTLISAHRRLVDAQAFAVDVAHSGAKGAQLRISQCSTIQRLTYKFDDDSTQLQIQQ